MNDTGNTEAPSHQLIVQKNESKLVLSTEERNLIDTTTQEKRIWLLSSQ